MKLRHAEHKMAKNRKRNHLGEQVRHIIGAREPDNRNFAAGNNITQELSCAKDVLCLLEGNRVIGKLGYTLNIRAN